MLGMHQVPPTARPALWRLPVQEVKEEGRAGEGEERCTWNKIHGEVDHKIQEVQREELNRGKLKLRGYPLKEQNDKYVP